MSAMEQLKSDILKAAAFPFKRSTLSETGTAASTYELEVLKTDSGVRVSEYNGPWNYWDDTSREDCLQARVEGGEDLYQKIALQCSAFGLRSWNGFSKSDPHALDGTMFSFEATLTDGTTISAHGSNAYPDHYRAFVEYIRSLLAPAR